MNNTKTIKFLLISGVTLLLNISSFAQTNSSQTTYARPAAKERFQKYVEGTIGPAALLGIAVSTTFKQLSNRPEEWGKTSKGFAKRVADGFGRTALRQTVTYGLDEAFRLDSNYYRSTKKSFGGRFSDAVVSAFTARKANGKKVFGIPRIIGTYAAPIIANETWMPKRYSYKDGLREGTYNFAAKIGFNVLSEFIF